jgi:Mce-associated membrane protein
MFRNTLVLGIAAVLLGAFAFWSYEQVQNLDGTAAARNTALTDTASTSEVKGQIEDAVNALFSYNYTDPAKTDRAARTLLTGTAVKQYAAMFGQVRQQGPTQKLVLTTTVTDGGVSLLRDGRARMLLYADQRNTRTTDGKTSYAAAMLTVDAIRTHDRWQIDGINPF